METEFKVWHHLYFPILYWPIPEDEAVRALKREQCKLWIIQQGLLQS